MGALLRTWAIVVVAAKRLLAQRWLALATVAGLVAAVALVISIPLYADAVYYRILEQQLSAANSSEYVKRPPFVFMFRYIGAFHGALELEDISQVDTYLSGPAARELGLPRRRIVRYIKTDNLRLFPTETVAYADVTDPLEWVNIGFISDLEEQIILVEGTFPAVSTDANSAMEVMFSERMADKLGLQIGEEYVVYQSTRTETGRSTFQMPIRIAGIWRAADPTSDFWFYNETALVDVLLVPEETYINRVASSMVTETYLALWYMVMDGSDVTTAEVGGLLRRISQVEQRASTLLSNTQLSVSPVDGLRRYQRSAGLLTTLLYAFSIPILGLLIAFIGLVVGLAVSRQRNEVAVLRSRGASVGQIVGISGLEALMLGLLSLLIAIPLSYLIAMLIGSTRSFLNFTGDADLRLNFNETAFNAGLLAVGLTFLAQVLPTFGAARFTIVTYKQEQARTLHPPWWQRMWFDLLLLIPAGYGLYLLRQQGSIAVGGMVTSQDSIFENPLLFLVPALGIFALALFTLRLLPGIMNALAWLSARTNSVGLLMASRYLARNRGLYTAPLLLLVLTLSLVAFTTSLAQTLDDHLRDRTYYQIGADARLIELGSAPPDTSSTPGATGLTPSAAGQQQISWTFVPVSEHLRAPEIEAAARFANFDGSIQLQGNWRTIRFIGIDRLDFPKVAFWRRDFAPATLGSLMNSLALSHDAVLLPRSVMRQNALTVGDTIQVQVARYGVRSQMSMKVMGEFSNFPTWYSEDGPILVANLDYLFEQLGGEFPYDVLVKTVPNVDFPQLARDLRAFDIQVVDWRSSQAAIETAQQQPERQGLFGVLSVGFLAAAILTVLGFLLYTLFSFRRRFIELGTLRAIGLSTGQMAALLAWELAFLVLVGIGIGTLLGVWMSDLFIPYLQVGTRPIDLTPPFIVGIVWPAIFRIYVLFGLLFVAALAVLVSLLMRMKIFQAIKLGETV
ncbi:MAG: ABC transporter permease [Caldilineaceae bacterium]|nr:ABC transporter permease [Caldilineaceae bacterium]